MIYCIYNVYERWVTSGNQRKVKLRKVGNSVVMTLSKEFLESIGATATDTVYVDEEKLKDIIVEKKYVRTSKKNYNK